MRRAAASAGAGAGADVPAQSGAEGKLGMEWAGLELGTWAGVVEIGTGTMMTVTGNMDQMNPKRKAQKSRRGRAGGVPSGVASTLLVYFFMFLFLFYLLRGVCVEEPEKVNQRAEEGRRGRKKKYRAKRLGGKKDFVSLLMEK